MKIVFSLFLLMTCLISSSIAQTHSNTFRQQISGITKYNKATGEIIKDTDLPALIESNKIIVFEPVIDKYGEVESFLVDLTRTHRRLERDTCLRVSKGEEFPAFVCQTVDKKKIDSEELRGKYVLLQFQLSCVVPFFKLKIIDKFNKLVNELQQENEIHSIVLFESSKDEILENIDVSKYTPEFVADSRNFSVRYQIITYPSVVLIDPEGKLLGYYDAFEIDKLREDFIFSTTRNSINEN